MQRRRFLALTLGLTAGGGLALSGCGGGGGSATGGATIDSAKRVAALDLVRARFESLRGIDPDTACQQIAGYLKGLPEFEAAGVSPDRCAWGRFTDGRLLIVVNNRAISASRARAPKSRASRAVEFLPNSPTVRIFDNLGSAFEHVTYDLAELLPRHGYQMAGGGVLKATVEELKKVEGDGIFYIESHGGLGSIRGGLDTYGIYSGTLTTVAAEEVYKADLDAGHLSYMIAEVDEDPVTQQRSAEPRYGIMPSFVEKYMKFGEASLVYFSACSSDNAEFKAACLRAGAGVYLGWTQTTLSFVAFSAATFLFDRLLGENKVLPVDPKDSYPMLLGGAAAALAKNINPVTKAAYDTAPDTGSKLTFTVGDTSVWGIAPYIVGSVYDSDSGVMTLSGYFGPNEGTVERDGTGTSPGQPVSVQSWQEKEIKLVLPDQVKTLLVRVGSRYSNVQVVGGNFTMSGPGGGSFLVRDAITVYVNGKVIYDDPAGATQGQRAPITFYAPMFNSKLRLTLRTVGTYGGTGEIFLKVPVGSIYGSADGSPQRIRPYVTDLITNRGQIDLGVVALL